MDTSAIDSNYSGGERARLRFGTSNDCDDDIFLQPTGMLCGYQS